YLAQQTQFLHEKWLAVVAFFGCGTIVRRAAVDASGDVTVSQTEAIVAMRGSGLIGEASAMQGGKQPIAGAIAGEDAAGAIAAMRRRSEAANQQPCFGIAKTRHRSAPVGFLAEGGTFLARHLLAPLHQARTGATSNNLGLYLRQALARHAVSPGNGIGCSRVAWRFARNAKRRIADTQTHFFFNCVVGTTQISKPPLPPGRSEAKYNIRPSRLSAGEQSPFGASA